MADVPKIPMPDMTSVNSDISSLSNRVRVGEERFNELKRKVLFLEQQQLAQQRKVLSKLKELDSDIMSMKHSIKEVEDRIIMLTKELQLCPKKQDVDVLAKYLEFWQPLKFVTMDQVIKVIREEMGKEQSEYSIENKAEDE